MSEESLVHPLKQWRVAQGFSYAKVASILRCRRETVQKYENGRTPQQPFLDRIVVMTNGVVNANSWLGQDAKMIIRRGVATSGVAAGL